MTADSAASPITDVHWQGRTCIARAAGDITVERSTAFQEQLVALLDDAPEQLVVDFGKVAFIDSSGMASLVKVLSRARKQEAELVLAGMSDRIRGVFEIARLDRVFHIESDVPDNEQEG
ncbi:MAG: STAS domain-containing protein [Phycisphaerae bacterium]|nr:STAS domain-containing protein [Phycisphaerae bacterium]